MKRPFPYEEAVCHLMARGDGGGHPALARQHVNRMLKDPKAAKRLKTHGQTFAFKRCFAVVARRVLVLSAVAGFAASAGPLEYASVRTANPLKGFMPFSGDRGPDALPHSMEFFYIPLKDLMDGSERFIWKPLDDRLDEIAGRGRHAVFRVYLDYPQKESGVPDFLRHGADGVAGTADDLLMREYREHHNKGLSLSPDYTDERLRAVLRTFIAAFGARYDGDPRIGFIQLGLIGFWGEWHTYPHSDWMPPLAMQEEILGAYDKAFDRTRLLVRAPKSKAFRNHAIGYHDDSFAYSTLPPPAWHFGGRLAAFGESERWRSEPIGGEVRPEIQPKMWEDPSIVPAGQDYEKCVAEIRPSWMLAFGAFSKELSPGARALADKQSRMLGYEFHVLEAAITSSTADKPVRVSATLRNTGVAPFYYEWPLEIAVLADGGKEMIHRAKTDWSLTGLIPGDPDRRWSHEIAGGTLPAGKYTLIVRAINPLEGGIPLRFANLRQDADLDGWLSLGEFHLK